MRLPEEPRRRTRTCVMLAVLSVAAGALVGVSVSLSGVILVGNPAAVPRAVFLTAYLPLFVGVAGAAYAMLQLPVSQSRRVAAALVAVAIGVPASYALAVALMMTAMTVRAAFAGQP